jgi:hypothetical protein
VSFARFKSPCCPPHRVSVFPLFRYTCEWLIEFWRILEGGPRLNPPTKYTTNGKRVEIAVKKVINGVKPSSLNTGWVFCRRSDPPDSVIAN